MTKHYTETNIPPPPTAIALTVTSILLFVVARKTNILLLIDVACVGFCIGIVTYIAVARKEYPQPRKGIEITEGIAASIVLLSIAPAILRDVIFPEIIFLDDWRDQVIPFCVLLGSFTVLSTAVRIANGLPVTTWGARRADKRAASAFHAEQAQKEARGIT